jgi:hypothetical protein
MAEDADARAQQPPHRRLPHLSGDGGKTWKRFDRGMEVSGYHHNVRGGFLMLKARPLFGGQRHGALHATRIPLPRAVPMAQPKLSFDRTHLGIEGANYFAAMVTRELAAVVPGMRPLLVR